MASSDLRRARRSDEDSIGTLWMALLEEQEARDERMGVADDARQRWANDFPMWITDETRRIFVAVADDEILGFASARRWGPPPVYRDEEEVFLDELYVRPSARRQGFGTQLVTAVREWAAEIEATRIRLRLLTANDDARAFWSAQDARPLMETRTIERPGPTAPNDDEGSSKIGF